MTVVCKRYLGCDPPDLHVQGCPLWPPPLPAPDERPVFGVHRQYVEDAETAPAWVPETAADREARFRRWAKGGRP